MTIIEFYDKDACENICSSLIAPPERIVLVGQKSGKMQASAELYHNLLKGRGADVAVECRFVDKNKMTAIIKALAAIVEEYEDCVFDLTGGDELFLTAVGIVAERYKEKNIQMHRVILRNGGIIDCDGDGVMYGDGRKPTLTVAEHFQLYGGKVVLAGEKANGTRTRTLTDALYRDVMTMWEICRKDVQLWNAKSGAMEIAFELFGTADSLSMTINLVLLEQIIKERKKSFRNIRSFVNLLSGKGLLTYSVAGDELTLTFKNEDVRDCLTKAGQLLELVVYCFANQATAKDGSKLFNDVMTGVSIDWDGEIHQGRGTDTENEIDVVMMHGMIPVFVSCKNGGMDANELYKLNTVAERFGGAYARKALISTAFAKVKDNDSLRLRAKDMNIRLVDNLAALDPNDRKDQAAINTLFRELVN